MHISLPLAEGPAERKTRKRGPWGGWGRGNPMAVWQTAATGLPSPSQWGRKTVRTVSLCAWSPLHVPAASFPPPGTPLWNGSGKTTTDMGKKSRGDRAQGRFYRKIGRFFRRKPGRSRHFAFLSFHEKIQKLFVSILSLLLRFVTIYKKGSTKNTKKVRDFLTKIVSTKNDMGLKT